MPKFKNVDAGVRDLWVLSMFCQNPTLSGPKMSKMIKKQFKHSMNTAGIYAIREAARKKIGLGSKKPGPPTVRVSDETQDDPFASRCVLAMNGLEDAINFQARLEVLKERGFVEASMVVEAISSAYIILAQGDEAEARTEAPVQPEAVVHH